MKSFNHSIFATSIDVIIPAYNSQSFIKEAIQSVLEQTYLPKSIIIVDDGSKDNTVKIVESLESDLIHLISLDKNRGPSYARNIAIKASTADYIAFLDSDDIWRPQKLEFQIKKLKQESDTKVCYSGAYVFDDTRKYKYHWRPLTYNRADFLAEPSFMVSGSASSVIVERDLLLKVEGFDENMRHCEDLDLWVKLFQETKFSCVQEEHIGLRKNPQSASRIRSAVSKERMFFSQSHYYNKWLKRGISLDTSSKARALMAVRLSALILSYLLTNTAWRNKIDFLLKVPKITKNQYPYLYKELTKLCFSYQALKFPIYFFAYIYTIIRRTFRIPKV